jgi:hypothetical protein
VTCWGGRRVRRGADGSPYEREAAFKMTLL